MSAGSRYLKDYAPQVRRVETPLAQLAAVYGNSVFVVAAPWIEMVLAIVVMNMIACPSNRCESTTVFQSILIYNFLFSLMIAGPVALPAVRSVSDDIYLGVRNTGSSVFAGTLAIFAVLGILLVAPFYAFAAPISGDLALAAFHNFALLGVAWIAAPILGALNSFRSVSLAFLAGAGAMIITVSVSPSQNATGMLSAFSLGVALANAIMIARLLWIARGKIAIDTRPLKVLRTHWTLAAIGLMFYGGVWADNFIMWFAAPSGVSAAKNFFRTMPDYDTPMFWAQLMTIPLLVLFAVHVEKPLTAFNKKMQASFECHDSQRAINQRVEIISSFIRSSMIWLFIAAMVLAGLLTLATFWGIDRIGLRASQMGMLRIGLLGAAFHSSMMFCFLFMLFFDMRKAALTASTIFMVANIVLTLALMPLGFAYYGYGNMLAGALAFAAAFIMLDEELPWLPYHAFVTSNVSLKGEA